MRISNELYDRIKWIALNLIPALEVLVLAIGKIWDLPYYIEIGATIAAIGVFLAAVIGVSKSAYNSDRTAGIIFEDEDTEVDEDEI